MMKQTMSVEHLEINSTYRNRNQWPSSGEFDVFISQSGVNNNVQAVDPYSSSAPILSFIPFTSLSGTISNYVVNRLGSSSDEYTLYVYFTMGIASKVRDYYDGIVMRFVIGSYTILKRILQWRYMSTDSGLNRDYFQVDLAEALPYVVPPGTSFTMNDASDFTDPDIPIVYIPNSVASTNYYINYILYNQTRLEWLPIVYYNGKTHMVQTDSTGAIAYTSGTWTATDTYTIRPAPPSQINTIVSVVSPTRLELASTATLQEGAYIGSFIRIVSQNTSRRIVAYDPLSRVVTLESAFPTAIPPGDQYEILQFSGDNFNPFQYNGSIASLREAVCYDVELLNLVLPNKFINTSVGSRAVFYPHVYVELTAINNSERASSISICSNNPNSRKMLFRALVFDTTNDTTSPFVRIDGGGMVQRIKLLPADNFHFSVHLPDGSVFSTETEEYYSPSRPNPLKQISALFSLKRVSAA
jgi:hypothetical protein